MAPFRYDNKNVVITLGTADDWGVRPPDHNPTIAIIRKDLPFFFLGAACPSTIFSSGSADI